MVKIIFKRRECIGCGSCSALCSDFWEMADDGKTILKGAELAGDEIYELEADLDKNSLQALKDSADCCPLALIELTNYISSN